MRKIFASLMVGVGLAFSSFVAPLAHAADMTVFKSPYCGCCTAWVDHMRENGFEVEVVDKEDISAIKRMLAVPDELQSCHTARINGYVIEGHVPAEDVKRLLAEKTDVIGLAVPGMPAGSPGMEMGERKDPYAVVSFGHKGHEVFNRH